MEDQQRIRKEMEDTRSSLTDKLEALETKVTEKVVQPVADAVEKASDVASDIVETVKETVHTVSDKVEETTKAVVSAFDIERHMDRHPWLIFGIAATTGCMVGSFLGRRSSQASHETWSRPKHVRGTNGASHHTEASPLRRAPKKEASEQESWIKEQMRHLGKLALSALMSSIRDLAKRSVPGPLGDRIGAEVENMTTSLGAEPIQGDVVAPMVERAANGKGSARERRESAETVNRLRTGGSSPDLL